MLYLVLASLIPSIFCSFINRSEFAQRSEPDDQLEYLADYLEGYAAMLSTMKTQCEFYDDAIHNYHRGLKESFLDDFKKIERLATTALSASGVEIAGESAFQDISTRFQECALRALPQGSDQQSSSGRSSRRRRRHHGTVDKSRMRVLECAEDAEIEIAEAVADSMNHLAEADGTKESDRLAIFAERNVKKMQRIVGLRRGDVWRWPWLTDEGWTWPWIVAACLIGIIIFCLLGLLAWFSYERLGTTEDSWGGKVKVDDDEEAQ